MAGYIINSCSYGLAKTLCIAGRGGALSEAILEAPRVKFRGRYE